jgi:hypothetical protein
MCSIICGLRQIAVIRMMKSRSMRFAERVTDVTVREMGTKFWFESLNRRHSSEHLGIDGLLYKRHWNSVIIKGRRLLYQVTLVVSSSMSLSDGISYLPKVHKINTILSRKLYRPQFHPKKCLSDLIKSGLGLTHSFWNVPIPYM